MPPPAFFAFPLTLLSSERSIPRQLTAEQLLTRGIAHFAAAEQAARIPSALHIYDRPALVVSVWSEPPIELDVRQSAWIKIQPTAPESTRACQSANRHQ